MSKPIHVTDAEFEKEVLQSDVPVVVDFWAEWCGPCRMIAPSLETLAEEYDGRFKVAKVDTDQNTEWAMRFGVQGIPNLLFVVNGQEVGRLVGAYPLPALKDAFEQVLDGVAKQENGQTEKEGESSITE